jgi:hypothetical protein
LAFVGEIGHSVGRKQVCYPAAVAVLVMKVVRLLSWRGYSAGLRGWRGPSHGVGAYGAGQLELRELRERHPELT